MNKEKNVIFKKDVLEGLKEIPSNFFDIIISDPPYNIGKDFGECKDNLPLYDYVEWSKKWMEESLRVLKPKGTLYVYGFSEILAHLYCASSASFKRWLVWHYSNKNAAGLGFWQRSHESILILSKEKPLFNQDDVREPYTDTFLKNSAGKKRTGTKSRFGSSEETVYKAHEKGALPRDVIKLPALAGGAGSKERAGYCLDCSCLFLGSKEKKVHEKHNIVIHPTQKPLELTRKLIRASKNQLENNKLLVLFSGTGAECVAGIQEDCEVIGFDINEEYIKMGNLWIEKELSRKNKKGG